MRIPLPEKGSLSRIRPAGLWEWIRRNPIVGGRRAQLLGAVLLVAVAIGSGTAATLDRLTGVPAGAAFRIGDDITTVAQLDDRMRLIGALYGVQTPVDPALLDTFHRSGAKAVAVSDILEHAAADRGIVVADKAAADQVTKLVQTGFPQGRDGFVAQLGTLGLSEADVTDEVRRQLANAQLYDSVTGDVALPTDNEVAAAYDERRADMVTPEKRHLQNIVVRTEEEAATARSQLDGGADFAAVAAASSLDRSTKAQGGDLGPVERAQLETAYGDAAFAASPNTVFGPVQTRSGWNVGKVLEIAPSSPLTLDTVRDALRTTLAEERRTAVWNSWLAERIADADVRYAADYEPADPDGAVDPAVPGVDR